MNIIEHCYYCQKLPDLRTFFNKKNKLKSRYIDDCKRCKQESDGNIRMLTFVNLRTYQNLTFYER